MWYCLMFLNFVYFSMVNPTTFCFVADDTDIITYMNSIKILQSWN